MLPNTCFNHKEQTKPVAGCDICRRLGVERRIIRKTVDALLKAGYALNVNNGGDFNELPKPSTSKHDILEALGAADEDFLFLYRNEQRVKGWVRFVYGNGGWDVLADYTENLEDVLKPVNDFADSLSE